MAEIKINLAQTNRQAQKLSDAADALKQKLAQLDSAIQSIHSCWAGNASDVFVSKLRDQYSDLSAQCRQMEAVAADIRSVAKRINAAEEATQKAADTL